jgi:hypothetical protein
MKTAKGWNLASLAEGLRPNDTVDVAVQIEEDAWSRNRGGSFWTLLLRDLR